MSFTATHRLAINDAVAAAIDAGATRIEVVEQARKAADQRIRDREQEAARQLFSKIAVGDRVESSKWGAGQPRIEGVVTKIDRATVTVLLDNGDSRDRTISTLRKVGR